MSIFSLITDIAKIVEMPVTVATAAAEAVTKPLADAAEAITEEIKDLTEDMRK